MDFKVHLEILTGHFKTVPSNKNMGSLRDEIARLVNLDNSIFINFLQI